MKKTKILLIILLGINFSIFAQTDSVRNEKKLNFKTALNTDVFFGFYPTFNGDYLLSEKSSFSFYGIMWAGGTGAGWGNWTEFGLGYKYSPFTGLVINPMVGLLNGSLTSGLGTPVLGEGIVPNLTVGLDLDKIEGELYSGYYAGFDHGNPKTNNYLHLWINSGFKFNKNFSLGLHYEHLRFTGGKNHTSNAAYDYYKSFGPYIQFSGNNSFCRFTTGADLRSDENVTKSNWKQPTFFKLSVGHSF